MTQFRCFLAVIACCALGTAMLHGRDKWVPVALPDDTLHWTHVHILFASTRGSLFFSALRLQGVPGPIEFERSAELYREDSLSQLTDLYRSENGGRTWRTCKVGPPGSVVMSIAEGSDEDLFAATLDDGIYHSTDDGSHWDSLGSPSHPVRSLVVGQGGKELYASTWRDGIFLSTDRGTSWTPAGLYGLKIRSIVMSSRGSLFASIEGPGFVGYRITNGGTKSERLSVPCGPFVSAGDGGILTHQYSVIGRSTDDGATWTALPRDTLTIQLTDIRTCESKTIVALDRVRGVVSGPVKGNAPWTVMNEGLPMVEGERWVLVSDRHDDPLDANLGAKDSRNKKTTYLHPSVPLAIAIDGDGVAYCVLYPHSMYKRTIR